jgi:DNA (cytosine-5)-methyltransferase 1
MTFGSLFSGIGGIDLGLERAGMVCKWQVEIDEYCRKVLTKHWPNVPKYGDITKLTRDELEPVDLIAGGFPCQDLSCAGKRTGIDGERSGLWREYARLIRKLRPRYVLIENVPGVLSNEPMRRVLGDLSALGFDAEWQSLPASAFGAPHLRYRVFIFAHSEGDIRSASGHEGPSSFNGGGKDISDHPQFGCGSGWARGSNSGCSREPEYTLQNMAHTDCSYEHGRLGNVQMGRFWGTGQIKADGLIGRDEWGTEPGVGRVAHGVPSRLERLRGLGNAVVPQVAEWIGRRIMEVSA